MLRDLLTPILGNRRPQGRFSGPWAEPPDGDGPERYRTVGLAATHT
jgi:hypothetical protein